MQAEKANERYVPKDETTIRQLAQKIYKNELFTSDHIAPERKARDLRLSFMPLAFLDEETEKWMSENDITFLYVDTTESSPILTHCINGYPVYGDVRMLDRTDHLKVINKYQEIFEAMEKI